MTKVLLNVGFEEDYLLDVLQPRIDAIVTERVASYQRRIEHDRERVRSRDEALDRAIQMVTRASVRVDGSRNTRDERRSITNLIAAADGLRRAYQETKGH